MCLEMKEVLGGEEERATTAPVSDFLEKLPA